MNQGFPFYSNYNEVVIIDEFGDSRKIDKSSKLEIAEILAEMILDKIITKK